MQVSPHSASSLNTLHFAHSVSLAGISDSAVQIPAPPVPLLFSSDATLFSAKEVGALLSGAGSVGCRQYLQVSVRAHHLQLLCPGALSQTYFLAPYLLLQLGWW